MSTSELGNEFSKMEQILQHQKVAFKENLPINNALRIDRLKRAIALLVDNANQIDEAVRVDWERNQVLNFISDVGDPITRLKHAAKNLAKWTRPKRFSPNFPFNLIGASAQVEYRPLGTVGIISPWNGPVMLSFGPLAAVFAAGNSAMIKPSEFVPTVAELLKNLVDAQFDQSELAVITGDAETGKAFSRLPFDHIVFTGSMHVAKHVLRAAAENLTPVTLELGGKSPVIIHPTADIEFAALRIMSGKALNAGQICVSPDYVFVHEDRLEEFINAARQVFISQYPNTMENKDYCAIINQAHFNRLKGYLKDATEKGAKVIPLVPPSTEEAERGSKLSMHLVINPPGDAAVMQNEIFGPILPVKTYGNEDQVIDYIQSSHHPLALYYFGGDSSLKNKLLAKTMAGDITINDVLFHTAQTALPFGGVGHSGNGSCYGIEGFRRLSYARSIYKQTPIDAVLNMMRPPYDNKSLSAAKSMIKK